MADPDDQQPEVTGPEIVNVNRLPDRECLECGGDALAVFAVAGQFSGQERTLGGWAWCQSCRATPHPILSAPNGRPLENTAPPGHSRSAHRVHGYCAACPGIQLWEELVAWRALENARRAAEDAPDRAAHPSQEGERARG
ncbi:hypothetical protein ACKI16_23935 [Streptomyces scabiei]|uniref:hypothetical protein n=1 Tax=Streptomyces scabiei TaxID=1930 RepID=UPI0038F6E0E8